jgi:hypothetical protein
MMPRKTFRIGFMLHLLTKRLPRNAYFLIHGAFELSQSST